MSMIDSIRPASDGSWGIGVSGSELVRYPPEPRNSTGIETAGQWLTTAAKVAGGALGGAIDATGAFGSNDIQDLLNRQIEVQRVMMVVSMASNVEKSKHETEMAPVRNMRVG